MKIKILFFGILSEEAAASDIEIEYSGDIEGLKAAVEEIYPSFKQYHYQVSLNRVIDRENRDLQDEDEVAFLPPFAGG